MIIFDYLACLCLVLFRIKWRFFTRHGIYNRFLLSRYFMGHLDTVYHRVCVDKYFVKHYLRSKFSRDCCVPTLEYYSDPNITFNYKAHMPCVIKPTHGSGDVLFLESGDVFRMSDYPSWLASYYTRTRQRMYRGISPGIIVEPVIFNDRNASDFKFFLLGGVAKFVQVDFDRFIRHQRVTYDLSWNKLDFNFEYPISEQTVDQPQNFSEMVMAVENIAEDFPDVRVDMYSDGNLFVIGELTFFHGGAGEKLVGNVQSFLKQLKVDE